MVREGSTPRITLLPSVLLLLSALPGPAEPQNKTDRSDNQTSDERARYLAAKSTLVGQGHAQEWVPALDLDFLRPPFASRDYRRPACELPAGSGKFTGVCTEDITEAPRLITFCSDLVRYRACVPAHQVMWPNWNATAKDLLLKDLFKDMVELRIAREMNVTPEMYVPIHYMSNPNCVHALRNALCWHNFPKCSDMNRSLALCRSTCNEYYSNCKFKPPFGACADAGVEAEGLFEAGVRPGPDQALADTSDTETCERRPTNAEIGITAEEEATVWFKTWWGIIVLTLSGLVVIALLGFILIPPVLMEYLRRTSVKLAWFPFNFWMSLPQLRGRKVIVLLALVFLALLAVGAYQMSVGGFKRWDEWEDPEKISEFQFKPPEYIWGTQATKPLTNQQLRQLQESCACTGDAYRGLPDVAVLTAAAWWAYLHLELL